ncbi:polygalacturonase [Flavobacterium rivuli WB 3.3-2 = DSM 21788]|uniref:Polygalacturonase n=1 Tax=Flavobacterium rivuli WB 3.3-2 = DSM 21788 TaxID=1121895 RepID=A0A0A2MCZ1_9FLAO|nr:glycoside hydrolase family 28 protein [Flavobacterium rivuli]KGO86135.1 polygalacturonase [Flavobacterium rivuli WB 3.3-2 = DSM 21788]
MKKHLVIIVSVISLFSCHRPSNTGTMVKINTVKVAAPFKMPAITIPDFSNCQKFLITDYGAVPGDKENTSKAIATAIAKATVNGGTVIIPKGEWQTGKVHLKSNVNLHLEEGAVLSFSSNPNDYLPAVHTTWEGMECYNYSPLVYAYNCINVAITGKGELRAEMETWQKWFARPKAHMNSLKYLYDLAAKDVPVEQRQMVNDSANLRPQFIQFNRCQNVLMDGVSVKNSPFWTVHPYLCKNVVIRHVNIYAHGHNNDGVDPEMSENVLIEDCIFDQGDDAVSVKSGRDHDAWRLHTPSKNTVIRNCLVKNGHQLIALGSELSGGIENVFIDNCEVVDGAKLNHLLFIKTNERRGGYVKNIWMQNVKSGKIDLGILGIETDVLYQWKDLMPTYKRVLTPISNIYLDNVHATDVKFISRVKGQQELPVNNVVLKKVTADKVTDKNETLINVNNFKREL